MLLALAVSTASAGYLRVSEKNFEIIWNAALGGSKTNLSFIDSGGHTISCPCTLLLGSFRESTIVKRPGSNIGHINHTTTGTCTAGRFTVLQETLPWEVQYSSFGGTLPRIERVTINIIRIALNYENGSGLACLFITETRHPFVGIIENFEAGGGAENLRAAETRTIELGGFVCRFVTPARFEGTALVRNLPGTPEAHSH